MLPVLLLDVVQLGQRDDESHQVEQSVGASPTVRTLTSMFHRATTSNPSRTEAQPHVALDCHGKRRKTTLCLV